MARRTVSARCGSACRPGWNPQADRGIPRDLPTACPSRGLPGKGPDPPCAAKGSRPRKPRVVGPVGAWSASTTGPGSSRPNCLPATAAGKQSSTRRNGQRPTPGRPLPAPPSRPRPGRLQSLGAAQGSSRRMQAMIARWDSSAGVVRPTRYPNKSGSCSSTNWRNASRSVGDAVAQTWSRYRVSKTSSSRMPRRQRQRSRAMLKSAAAVTCPHPGCGPRPHPTCGRPLLLTREK